MFLPCTGYLRKLYVCPAANVILNRQGNTVSEQKWGLAAHCQTQAEDKGGWGKKKVCVKMSHHLEEWGTPCLQAPLFWKTQKKKIVPRKTETYNHALNSHSPLENKAARWMAPWSLWTWPTRPLPSHSALEPGSWGCCQPQQPAMLGLHPLAKQLPGPAFLACAPAAGPCSDPRGREGSSVCPPSI